MHRNQDIISLPVVADPRGNLTFMQHGAQIPFVPRRVTWLHDIRTRRAVTLPAAEAPRMIVALSGAFTVGDRRLIDPSEALLVPAGVEVTFSEISHNAVPLVITGELPGQSARVATPVHDSSHAYSLIDDSVVRPLDTCRAPGALWAETTVCDTPVTPLRLFYLYDVPAGSTRGGHSHIRAHEIITAASGSFDVTLTDGHDTRTYRLNDPSRGLYIPPGLWRTIDGFSSGSVCLVLTTELYSEVDYVRDYETFKQLTQNKLPR